MKGSSTRYSSSALLKNAQTCRDSASWEPAKRMGAVAFTCGAFKLRAENAPSKQRLHRMLWHGAAESTPRYQRVPTRSGACFLVEQTRGAERLMVVRALVPV